MLDISSNSSSRCSRYSTFLFFIHLFISIINPAFGESIHEELLGRSLNGTWSAVKQQAIILGIPNENNTEFFSFFSSKSGRCQALITQFIQGQNKITYIYIQLLNTKYINDQVVQISLLLDKGYNDTQNQWKTPKILTAVKAFRNFKQIATFDINLNFQLSRDGEGFVRIKIISNSIYVQLKLQQAQYTILYFLFLLSINIIQIILLLIFDRNQNILANTSQWLLIQQEFFLFLQTLLFFKLAQGYYDTNLHYLFFNIILNLTVMGVLLWKFTAVMQKFKNGSHLLKLFAFLIGYFLASYFFYTDGMFWVIQSLLFLWQISYSANRGGNQGISIILFIVIILSRIPLIILLCLEENILSLKPDIVSFWIISLTFLFHGGVLYFQQQKGTRFFIPKTFIPNYYNYFRQTIFMSEIAEKQCAICLNQLRQKPNSQSLQQSYLKQMSEEERNKKITFVEANCRGKHKYHQQCLSDWLNVHLVCPVCKTGLPPMNIGAAP